MNNLKSPNISFNVLPWQEEIANAFKMWRLYKPVFKYEDMFDDLGGPWAGHKYFAYDLVRNFKPKRIVELGTHLGCSLFSFAQAVYDGKINTKLDAVDTWQGDKHSRLYGENILSRVKEIKAACYPNLDINLVRKTFDQASYDYPNNTIDLLHIDGLHTYRIVKHDFETWLPKVKQNGIILLHDTAVRKWGFGVYKLFDQIKQSYKTLEFTHSYGLGVIFKDAQCFTKLEKIFPSLNYFYTQQAEKSQLIWDLNKQSSLVSKYKKQLDLIQSAKTYKIWQFYNYLLKRKILKMQD